MLSQLNQATAPLQVQHNQWHHNHQQLRGQLSLQTRHLTQTATHTHSSFTVDAWGAARHVVLMVKTSGGTTRGTKGPYVACRWGVAGFLSVCCSLAHCASPPVGTSFAWWMRERGMGHVLELAFAASHGLALVVKEVTVRIQTDLCQKQIRCKLQQKKFLNWQQTVYLLQITSYALLWCYTALLLLSSHCLSSSSSYI